MEQSSVERGQSGAARAILEGNTGPVLAICSVCFDYIRQGKLPNGSPAYWRTGPTMRAICARCYADRKAKR